MLRRELEKFVEESLTCLEIAFNDEEAAEIALRTSIRRMRANLPRMISKVRAFDGEGNPVESGFLIFRGSKYDERSQSHRLVEICTGCFTEEATAFRNHPVNAGICQSCVAEKRESHE